MRAGLFSIILILAFLFFKDLLSGVGSASSLLYVGLMVILIIPFFFFGSKLKNKDRTDEQAARTEKTITELHTDGILSDVKPQNLPAHCPSNSDAQENTNELTLFLRPFATDQFEFRNPDLDGSAAFWIPLYKFLLPTTVAFDDALRYALPTPTRFVAISSEDHIGAAKLHRTDENWKQAFEDLTPRAKYIIIVPGVRDGTKWEIGRLVQLGLISKCLFIFLPFPMFIKYETSEAFEFESVKTMLSEFGLRVPDKSPDGDKISIGDAVVFGDNGKLVVHGSNVVETSLLSCNLNISRIKKCLKLMLAH